MLIIKENPATEFQLAPAGPIAARCSRLIDLGSQPVEFQGESKMQRKIQISWELSELRDDGEPFMISRRFGLSLHEKASLRKFLESWRGRPFTKDELAGFDLTKLLNAPCLLNIGHVERAGKQYANIMSISPLPKGMTAPELTAPPFVFDIDEQPLANAIERLETLSDNLRSIIETSPEWQRRIAESAAGPVSAAGLPAAADLGDDIPF